MVTLRSGVARLAVASALVVTVLPSAGIAQAPEAYSAEDVIRFFEAAREPEPQSGPAALCLGTPEECRETAAPSARPGPAPESLPEDEAIRRSTLVDRAPGFDLLVTFDLNSARLTPDARRRLDVFAKAALSPGLAALRFQIEGHTDALGDDAANADLSSRRALAVVDFLVERGVSRDRLGAVGFGETRPREADPYDPGNRRVESRLLPSGETAAEAADGAGTG